MRPILLILSTLIVLAWPAPGRAQVDPDYDEDNAKDIMDTCAGCHGKDGEGGGDGTYPRLAGMSDKYLAAQLRAFKAKERINLPMIPYASERELPEEDVRDISIYLSQVELLTIMPRMDEDMPALERLLLARRVFNVPRVDGDGVRGAELYQESCRRCHGKDGWGRGKNPPLAGQYTDYLRRQIRLMREGKRAHKKIERYIDPLTETDLDDLFAYLASVDD